MNYLFTYFNQPGTSMRLANANKDFAELFVVVMKCTSTYGEMIRYAFSTDVKYTVKQLLFA